MVNQPQELLEMDFGSVNLKPEKKAALQPYASAFWVVEPTESSEFIRVHFGWAIPKEGDTTGTKFESGSWPLRITGLQGSQPRFFLNQVEEPLGIIFSDPTEAQQSANEHCERLIADELLLFVNRTCFSRNQESLPLPKKGLAEVNTVLIFGPTLPKFIGRICYSHMNRSKTIAVLCPNHQIGRMHTQQEGDWDEFSEPPMWEDSSVRSWHRKDASSTIQATKHQSSAPQKIASYQLIVPAGDGFAGIDEQSPELSGREMWGEKRGIIKKLLDEQNEVVALGLWNCRPIYLPHGMAKAAYAAYAASINASSKKHMEIQNFSNATINQKKTLLRLAEDKKPLIPYVVLERSLGILDEYAQQKAAVPSMDRISKRAVKEIQKQHGL